ncbi:MULTISPECIES: hypothetical protein [Lysinibacillus]|jgi:hypothetical protein|uniref:hypothetical protein n=1 Tax=Lysinibacillus TaxID=400634 RepID=UPI000561262F|nr:MULTISPECIES: hypothetical protein [Lysinibacillus]MEE3809350.1 hypothetical protein [Lysinibacillus fusiformis]KUF33517.1 hypothetical protein AK833_11020 [Lysinibacillus sp. F5]WCH47309.1 hypothetical protein NV349_20165 [Lysinibacillus sp. OF-1]SCZ11934.1 hypothetical protein SAMN02787078_04469 [Lysinibacillus sp. SG9]SDB56941.1 hypothetical protein SAMN02787079_04505 [Lysinibacillus sp. TC-37]
MRRNLFTAISILSLLLIFFLFGYDSTKWYGGFFTFLYQVNMFMPFILGGLGIVSALLGIKGYRMVLVVLHSFLLLLFLGIYFKAFYGFNEP